MPQEDSEMIDATESATMNEESKNGKSVLGAFEFEYVNMDENILAPGRVSI